LIIHGWLVLVIISRVIFRMILLILVLIPLSLISRIIIVVILGAIFTNKWLRIITFILLPVRRMLLMKLI